MYDKKEERSEVMEIIYFLVFIFALKCALKVMLHPIRTVKAFKELLFGKETESE